MFCGERLFSGRPWCLGRVTYQEVDAKGDDVETGEQRKRVLRPRRVETLEQDDTGEESGGRERGEVEGIDLLGYISDRNEGEAVRTKFRWKGEERRGKRE